MDYLKIYASAKQWAYELTKDLEEENRDACRRDLENKLLALFIKTLFPSNL